jgi:hypothetical protein
MTTSPAEPVDNPQPDATPDGIPNPDQPDASPNPEGETGPDAD